MQTVPCPADNCTFQGKSARSVSTHWAHKHQGPCPLTTEKKQCIGCGNEFHRSHAQLRSRNYDYCSRECWTKAVANPVELTCQHCGQQYQARDGHQAKHRRFCSLECGAQAQVGIYKTRALLLCAHCGNGFHEIAYRRAHGRAYCSPECWNRHRDQGKTVANDKWRQAEILAGWRDAVFARDNYTCTCCGVKSSRQSPIQAHHLVPVATMVNGMTEQAEMRQHPLFADVSNGVTLCERCHGLEHHST